jgi:cation diffusion facilitator family transporter
MEISLKQRTDAINRVTLWGVLVNILLASTKLVGGIVGQSQALIADGLHSASDLASDGMVLLAAKHASEDADEDHPYGHERFETIGTVALGTLLVIVGLGIGYDAIVRLVTDQNILSPDPFTLWIAAFSILCNEALYHYTKYVGNNIRSKLLLANAWHHRSDAVSSIVVFIGIAGTQLDMPKLDAYAAIVVGLMIVKIGVELGYHSMQELVDKGLDPDIVKKVREQILAHEDVRELHRLRSRKMGHKALVDVHIEVAPKLSVSEGHHISETVEKMLMDNFDDINDVTVHIDPEDDEQEACSMSLPLRSELIIALNNEWSKIPELSSIDDVTLHYLAGRISVEASMPLDSISSVDDSRKIQEMFNNACMNVDCVSQSKLRFH